MQQQVQAIDTKTVSGNHHVLQAGAHELTGDPELAVLSEGAARRSRNRLNS